jgi:hypothetical protein
LKAKEEVLREKRLRAEAEAVKIRKAERKLQKQRRLLWKREKQNITELELDEAFTSDAPVSPADSEPASGIPLSLISFSQMSFDFLNNTSLIPTDNS